VLFTLIHIIKPMEIDASTYPSRAFIRFTAQNQLLADLTGKPITAMIQRQTGENYVQQVMPTNGDSLDELCSEDADASSENTVSESATLDEALFEEIAKTSFSPNRYPELYQSCGTRRAAAAIEIQVANEIVAIYKEIKKQQQNPIVQNLNSLL